jgi:hypothetical protein
VVIKKGEEPMTKAAEPTLSPSDLIRQLRALKPENLDAEIATAETRAKEALGQLKELKFLRRSLSMRAAGFPKRKKPAAAAPADGNGSADAFRNLPAVERVTARLRAGPGSLRAIAADCGLSGLEVGVLIEDNPELFEKQSNGLYRLARRENGD